MNVLAIVGSRRVGSYNLQVAQAAGELLKQRRPDVTFTILNWDDVPFMNEDSEHPEPPAVGVAYGKPFATPTACGCSAPNTTTLFPGRSKTSSIGSRGRSAQRRGRSS